MKIKRMTATFGALDNAVLTPGDGLTVISAPNEGGKSTWAGSSKDTTSAPLGPSSSKPRPSGQPG